MMWIVLLFCSWISEAQVKSEGFIIQIDDRRVSVLSPTKKKSMFSVIVENRSLSDQIGKFMAKGENLKFISVKSGKSEAVEIENKTEAPVIFVPLSPAFQEVPLIFGKKAYEIPSKK